MTPSSTTPTPAVPVPAFARPGRRWKLVVRGLLILAPAVIAVFAWRGWQSMQPHLNASAYLTAFGVRVDWRLDPEDWTRGGYTTVQTDRATWQVGDAELPALSKLHRLQVLDLGGAQVTDAGLVHLATLTGLRELDLGPRGPKAYFFFKPARPISDAGLVHIKRLTRLTTLGLGDTAVTDAGLANLAGMTALEELDLRGTLITDAGLRLLARLPRLKSLNVAETRVTRAGVDALRQARSDLQIISSFDDDPAGAMGPR